ncbi:hypothetical protein ACIQWA_03270 [Kitasatospora sp. NPDC098652]|uniref:hypothetical protein n=1 Tax=Kitasatospora sp. NPDC098652 TaxID=3364095 RepID=UPI0037F3E2E9
MESWDFTIPAWQKRKGCQVIGLGNPSPRLLAGAPHPMAVNETIAAVVLGGTASGAAGGVGTVTDWATAVEFLLPGGRRKVRPDAVCSRPRRSGRRC